MKQGRTWLTTSPVYPPHFMSPCAFDIHKDSQEKHRNTESAGKLCGCAPRLQKDLTVPVGLWAWDQQLLRTGKIKFTYKMLVVTKQTQRSKFSYPLILQRILQWAEPNNCLKMHATQESSRRLYVMGSVIDGTHQWGQCLEKRMNHFLCIGSPQE